MAIEKGKSFAYMALEKPSREEIKLEWLMDFCYAASERLEELGMTRTELAKKLRKSPSNVTRVLSGRANITLETMAEYSEALDICLELKRKDNNEAPVQPSYSVDVAHPTAQSPRWIHQSPNPRTVEVA